MIIDELLDLVKEDLQKKRVIDVRVGLIYTGILLEDGGLGLAYSFIDEVDHCCRFVESAGELDGNAWELAKMARSSNIINSSIGVATINAEINKNVQGEKGPLIDFLDIKPGDKIGMVGDFKPVADKIEEDVDLYVFERSNRREDVYPDWAVERILPKIDISIITGTSVVNDTVDHLIELSKNAREIAILGPTTPLSKTVFGKHRVTLLGGMVVEDVDKALKIVSQAGGTRRLGNVSEKISVIIP